MRLAWHRRRLEDGTQPAAQPTEFIKAAPRMSSRHVRRLRSALCLRRTLRDP
ncbi:MAG: hypothetical protein MZW92_36165 [Comamonadaceae bacterium]|nr:hypothetical protein [Comamonadaceae bacterium]